MSNVIISTDSIADLSDEILEKYSISRICLHVVLDDQVYTDGVDISPEDIYRVYDEKKVLPKTTAINVGEYEEYFEKLTADGSEVVHFCTGSGISSCYQNAKIAAADYENVYVVDSLNLSSGVGLQVLAAADNAKKGMSGKEIFEEAEKTVSHVEAGFILDTLEFLYKGGRCSALSMFGANLLKIRPTIKVDPTTGKMGVDKKFRGTHEKCISMYIQDKLEGRNDIVRDRVFITNSQRFTEEEEKFIVDEVMKYGPFDEVIIGYAGSTISSHCGPKCFGVLFLNK